MPDGSIPVGDDPWGIAITSDGSTVVVACEDDNTVHFLDTASLTTSWHALPTSSPRDVEIAVGDATAYLPSGNIAGDDAVFVIDLATQTMVGSVTLTGASNPNVVAVAPQLVQCQL